MQKQYSIKNYWKPADAITIFSLLSGFAAIIFFVHGNFFSGSLALLAAAFFDWLDGKVARKFGGGTAYGKALDIADLVSFGAAPAVLISVAVKNYFGYAAAAIFLTASLLRLARFQIEETNFSIGMPTTANGIIFPVVYFLQSYFGFDNFVFAVVALASSALMLSSFETKKYL